ncbi:phosphoenolpyruvate-protein phosphotransferase [Paenibacillus swuensis]|uniref:Phosphoenolpyruvate-protein phosphotransferase n=1 Tax=Paenibacillus swuensis TaxID=1178515 RepID=A0A172THY9_9BACL|nr:phosphoenolpyruvate--protein phosphotransferase [Paenibacillus swuensis]ANE46630.1 phosphoenolpyruvate-protein phosphotransferase [Paenibacillus swuensis]
MVTLELKGIAAAPGVVMGRAKHLAEQVVDATRVELDSGDVDRELARFNQVVAVAAAELESLRAVTLEKLGAAEAEIFETHQLLLKDEEFVGGVEALIGAEHVNAEYALKVTVDEICAVIESIDDAYLRERAADIRDVGKRLARGLARSVSGADAAGQVSEDAGVGGAEAISPAEMDRLPASGEHRSEEDRSSANAGGAGLKQVLLAADLTPSETAQLDREAVAAFATEIGGRTSHSAIMARSMDIPAVVGLGEALRSVPDGALVIVDGSDGVVHVSPDADTIARYERRAAELAERKRLERRYLGLPSVTRDGRQVELVANIGSPRDAAAAQAAGAEGIGLYRTEFLYMDRADLPSEEEQYAAYSEAAEVFGAEAPVVIRTLDIGGDKKLPYLPLPEEENPFLGVRAIRLCLDRHDLFRTQLRAILRAGVHGNVKIMFPMIATLGEWQQATAQLEIAKQELRDAGQPYADKLEVGIMIEVPSAALMADVLAKEVDFFSIGTNDLVQYVMAADRMNEKLAYLSDPFYPAVLRLIRHVIRAATAEGKWVGMCGEMAGHLTALPLLLGMGLHEFSMSASAVLPARALLSKLNSADATALADELLQLTGPEQIRARLEAYIAALNEEVMK